jgi:hypothetical protein
MAAREIILNFAKILHGFDSNNLGHPLVVLVCKFEVV